MSSEQNEKKRRRMRNTTAEQYNLYLQFMEGDYFFKSNTINPTLEPNYLERRWEDLANQLNSLGDGPQLTPDELKKRFTDWKYAVRMRYRKIHKHRLQTGSGPSSDLKLSETEERAFGVWGKDAVVGAAVTTYEGLPGPSTVSTDVATIATASCSYEAIVICSNEGSTACSIATTCAISPIFIDVTNSNTLEANIQRDIPNKENKNGNLRKRKANSRPKPLSVLTEHLLNSTKETYESQKELLLKRKNIIKKFPEDYNNT